MYVCKNAKRKMKNKKKTFFPIYYMFILFSDENLSSNIAKVYRNSHLYTIPM